MMWQLVRLSQPHWFLWCNACRDGGVMAKDVHAALVAIVADHMGKKESLAIAHLSAMMTQKRYIRDIWS